MSSENIYSLNAEERSFFDSLKYVDISDAQVGEIVITGFRTGFKHTKETKEVMRNLKLGKKLSESHKKNLSKSHLGIAVSEEAKLKISKANAGHRHSEESKKLMSKNRSGKGTWNKGIPQPRVTCPHCNKTGGAGRMKNYHFDHCKLRNI